MSEYEFLEELNIWLKKEYGCTISQDKKRDYLTLNFGSQFTKYGHDMIRNKPYDEEVYGFANWAIDYHMKYSHTFS